MQPFSQEGLKGNVSWEQLAWSSETLEAEEEAGVSSKTENKQRGFQRLQGFSGQSPFTRKRSHTTDKISILQHSFARSL